MNITRMNQAIAIMKRAKNLQMDAFQRKPGGFNPAYEWLCNTEDELHKCGNTACFAGYVAISPEFKADGGSVGTAGSPTFKGSDDAAAIVHWLGISSRDARRLVYGFDDYYGKPFSAVTPADVIAKLEQLKEEHS